MTGGQPLGSETTSPYPCVQTARGPRARSRAPPAQAAREYQGHPTVLVQWRKEHLQYADRAFTGNGRLHQDEARIAELGPLLGLLPLEHAPFKKALLRLKAHCREWAGPGGR
jgi:transposase-like protein